MKLTEGLVEEDKLKGSEIVAAFLALAAGAVWMYLDGFTGKTIAEVTTTLSTAAVILVTFVNRMKRQEVTNFVDAGSKALSKLQKEYKDILSGPRAAKRKDYSLEETTPEKTPTDEHKYLFFQKEEKGQQAQFIPVMPFKEADVAIFLGPWALRIATRRSVVPIPMEVAEAKVAVQNAIKIMAEREFPGKFEEIAGNGNMCIALYFDKNNISAKEFELAVYKIGKTALGAISSAKKGENNG